MTWAGNETSTSNHTSNETMRSLMVIACGPHRLTRLMGPEAITMATLRSLGNWPTGLNTSRRTRRVLHYITYTDTKLVKRQADTIAWSRRSQRVKRS